MSAGPNLTKNIGMEFADIITKRIEGENDPKKPVNILICFSKKQTGKALGEITHKMIRNKPGKSSITMLNLINREQAEKIGDENIYKSELFADIHVIGEADRLTVRTFVKHAENFVAEVVNTAEEQNCNIIFFGVGQNIFNASLWNKYVKLRNEANIVADEDYQRELGEKAVLALRNISTLLNRHEQAIGIFIPNNFPGDVKRIFVPILKESDICTFPYFYQIAKNTDVSVMIWDAIGIIESNVKLQKTFQYISRKTDSRMRLWNNNKKIENDFISEQDLMIIGYDGWEKLIGTPLTWIDNLPSVLVIKDKRST